MIKTRFTLSAIISLLFISGNIFAQLSGTYTIDASQPASATNYKNFTSTIKDLNGTARTDGGPAHGAGGVSGAVTFNVAAGGTYNEQITVVAVTGASAINTITYNGNGATLAFASSISSARAVIEMNGPKYFTFNNLKINSIGGTYGYGVHLFGIAEYNTINKCTILSDSTFVSVYGTVSNYAGVVASAGASLSSSAITNSANHCTISNCLIVGGQVGVDIEGGGYLFQGPNTPSKFSYGMQVLNNTIRDFFTIGIAYSMTDSVLISGNDINRLYRKDATFNMKGIVASYDNYDFAVKKNRIHNFASSAVTFQAAGVNQASELDGITMRFSEPIIPKNGSITNNLIYDLADDQLPAVTTNGIYIWYTDYSLTTPDRIDILNNTIVYNSHVKPSKNYYGIYFLYGTSGITSVSPPNLKNIQNNIISMWSPGGSGRNLGLYLYIPDRGVNSDYNVFDLDTLTSCTATYFGGKSFYFYSLYDWQRLGKFTNGTNPTVVFDQHSIFCKPYFNNSSIGDFTPQNSLISNAGTDWFTPGEVTDDITGAPRNTTPTIGAFQVTEKSVDAGIDIVKEGQNLCGSSQVKITLMNNGATIINTATIGWSVNGVTQTPAIFSALNLAAGATTNLVLGSYNFTSTDVASGYAVKANITLINGSADPNTFNNNASDTLKKGLSGTYTINQSSVFGGTNFISFSQAADYLNTYGICSAVVLNVSNGPYTDRMILTEITGASAVNTVTVNGNSQVITYSSNQADPIIFLNGTDYFTLDNLIVKTGSGYSPVGIMFKKHADHNTIKNCTLYGNFSGIAVLGNESTGSSFSNIPSLFCADNTSHSTFDNNQFIGWFYGICVNYLDPGNDGGTLTLSKGNRYTNNIFKNISGNAIMLNNTDSALISGNDISNPDSSAYGVPLAIPAGVYFAKYVQSCIIERNTIHNIYGGALKNAKVPSNYYGFDLRDTYTTIPTANLFRNNLIYDIKDTAQVYGFYENSAYNTLFYHNTISLDDTAGKATKQTCAAYYNNASHASQIYNNIFSVTRGGIAKNYGILATGTFTSDNNDFNVKGANAFIGNTSLSLGNWQGFGNDVNGKALDPLFVDASAFDFHPTEVLLKNMGRNLQALVPKDYDGVARPVTPDPGAFQIDGVVIDSIITSAISPLIYCAGSSINVPFTCVGSYKPGNIFTAQLSDISGSFSTPVVLGTFTSSSPGSHTITGLIPIATTASSTYQIRVVASAPNTISINSMTNITINLSPVAGIISVTRDTICAETPANLTITGSSGGIQWQSSVTAANFTNISGATNSTYKTSLTTDTYFRAFSSNGTCSDTSVTKVIRVIPAPVISFTSAYSGLKVTFTSAQNSTGITAYSWDFGDSSALNPSVNPVHTYSKVGTYYVCLTVYNGSNCSFTTCQYVSVATGINNIGMDDSFIIYPNPFASTFSVLNKNFNEPVESIEIYNVLGEMVYNNTYHAPDKIIEVDLSGLAQASYIVKIKTIKSVYLGRIIKE